MISGRFPNDEIKRNYQRNKTLIDLGCIPSELRTEILDIYKEAPQNERSKILSYFIKTEIKNTYRIYRRILIMDLLISEILDKVSKIKKSKKRQG